MLSRLVHRIRLALEGLTTWLFSWVALSRFNTMRPRQNGRHFADDMFKCIFLNENLWIPIEISLKFVPRGSINNIPALVQIMAWRRSGDKPLSEPMMVSLPTHICVTRPQWDTPRGANIEHAYTHTHIYIVFLSTNYFFEAHTPVHSSREIISVW